MNNAKTHTITTEQHFTDSTNIAVPNTLPPEELTDIEAPKMAFIVRNFP